MKTARSFDDSFNIGTLAKRTGVKVPTIRYYETIGLLPTPSRGQNGYRRYRHDHESRLIFIRRARDLGFSIDQIRDLATLSDATPSYCDQARIMATTQLEDITTRIRDLERLRDLLTHMVDQCASNRRAACPIIEALSDQDLAYSDINP